MVSRTDLITEPAVLAEVDAQLAARAARWPSMTQGWLAAEIDRVVAVRDPDAVNRVRERVKGREPSIWESQDGISEVYDTLFSTDAKVLDERLDALVATVCDADPRTRDQRRADALGALAAGAERLRCACGSPDCDAGARAGWWSSTWSPSNPASRAAVPRLPRCWTANTSSPPS
jgi:hypothetical protein